MDIFFSTSFTSESTKDFWGLKYSIPALLISFKDIIGWMSIMGIITFIGLLIYNIFYAKKSPNLIALTSIIVIYIWLYPLLWDAFYFYMIPFFHSLQYFLFSGAYTKNKINKKNLVLKDG